MVYGGNTTAKVNLFHQIFGTSLTSIVINSIVILIGLYLISTFVIVPIARLVLDVFDFRRLRARQLVFLELTPSSGSNKSMLATAQLVVGLHGLISASSLRDRLLRHKKSLSVEVVSTRAEGIRYVVLAVLK